MKIRIGNIEFNEKNEILRWYPCKYHGKKQEYLDKGYVEKDGFLSKENVHVDARFFDAKELCCTIAYVVPTTDWFDINSVGTRLVDLDETDFKNLKRVVEIVKEDWSNDGE